MMIFRMFCPWRNEIACEWIKIHNEGLNDLYSSSKIFRVNEIEKNKFRRFIKHVGCLESYIKGFGVETERKVPLWRLKRRWDNVIKMDFQEVRCRGKPWI